MMTGSLQKTQTTERYGKKMDSIKVSALYNTEETIAKELFKDDCYPWEILPKIKDFILTLGPTLPKDKFDEIEKNVWVAKSAVVAGPIVFRTIFTVYLHTCNSIYGL